MRAALVLFFALGMPSLAVADIVVPIDSVEQFVNIRAETDVESDVIGRLYQGDNMQHVQSVDGWHEIEIEPGLNGYISSDWATVFADAEAAAAAAEMLEAIESISESSTQEVFEEALAVETVFDEAGPELPVEAE